MSRPGRLAIVSTGIRRDLVAPLKHFNQFEILHFYRHADYGDLTPEDLDATLRPYRSPVDLYHQLVRSRPVVIQGVEPFSVALQPSLWACYLAARATGARLLAVTLENRPLEDKFNRLAASLLYRLLHFYFKRACLVIVLNNGARRNLEKCGISHVKVRKMMWGTWGVDLDEFAPVPAPRDQPPTVLFAGRLTREKGILVLLEAFARVQTTLPEARLNIVGDGSARAEVQARVRVMDGVNLAGVVKNRQMPEVFRKADVVAMPSLTTGKWEEQVGMVALQAMACGIPIVASRSGAIPEYVPDKIAGLLVPENNAEALAGTLLQVLRDRDLRDRLGRGARGYACQHYDAAKNIRLAEREVLEHCL